MKLYNYKIALKGLTIALSYREKEDIIDYFTDRGIVDEKEISIIESEQEV